MSENRSFEALLRSAKGSGTKKPLERAPDYLPEVRSQPQLTATSSSELDHLKHKVALLETEVTKLKQELAELAGVRATTHPSSLSPLLKEKFNQYSGLATRPLRKLLQDRRYNISGGATKEKLVEKLLLLDIYDNQSLADPKPENETIEDLRHHLLAQGYGLAVATVEQLVRGGL